MVKVLIVDDDRQLRGMLKQMLERAHFSVIEAASGVSAVEVYNLEQPDVIILDMMTPEKDGLEVIEELKINVPDLKIVAISGGFNGDTSWLVPIAETLGVTHFLNKPFSQSQIINAVNAVLEVPA